MGATMVFEMPAAVPPASQSLAIAMTGLSFSAAAGTVMRLCIMKAISLMKIGETKNLSVLPEGHLF